MEKRVTVNELARMVATGFGRMEHRFDALEGRVDGVEGKMGTLEEGIGVLEERMGALETEVRGTNKRIDTMIPMFDTQAHRIMKLEEEVF
ncbi:MAG TPA: hypothetical protein VGN56_02265 [Candidatus Paceibacterota bacterium]|nr:hypothetical protein [Candidatus Paceibacterota bacterium]